MTKTFWENFLKAGFDVADRCPAQRRGGAACIQPAARGWRNFEMVTRGRAAKGQGATQAWIPLPSFSEPEWTRPMGSTWQTNARVAALVRDPKYGAEMLHLTWDGSEAPAAEVTSKFATRGRAVDLAKTGTPTPLSPEERKLYTDATELIPTEGIVKKNRRQDHRRRNPTDVERRAPSTSGSSTTRTASRRPGVRRRRHRDDAQDEAISAASAPTSTRSTSGLAAPSGVPGPRRLRHSRSAVEIRLSEPGTSSATSPRRSTAAPRSISQG